MSVSRIPPDEVTEEWRDRHVPPISRRRHPSVAALQEATAAPAITEGRVEAGIVVVEVPGSSGVPSLPPAEVGGPSGRVTALDPSSDFVVALRGKVARLGSTNLDGAPASPADLRFSEGRCCDAPRDDHARLPHVRTRLTGIWWVVRGGRRPASETGAWVFRGVPGGCRAVSATGGRQARSHGHRAGMGSRTAPATAAGFADIREGFVASSVRGMAAPSDLSRSGPS